ncbi:NAD-dependent epimerase/dehydratase family protein [Clostridium estertheticum]|uniref:NAD-dependent epimerase/dehydratase family protein n=1 Tax=Clostridium estertheticum TaxID=238834 RepID=A0A5N7J5E9_9CLOT|nr:NAD-dependent epimerase/dehydratase family protein [Clostridium estertheticum]MPQ33290.1 NAD-dependent epimerase/dehydratase family protein [Clostridium estertheticum]MPQ63948.1 NAD-dependent epimerase/dehydratase family protein [Clostridium estertheticum]
MKKILITGANSYIGTSLEKWLKKYSDKYLVDTVDMKDGTWKRKDFSGYDVVFHVAGIAHIKETKENVDLYYKVNRDLVYEVAQKAKEDGIKQFIFLSSMSIYGMETGVISKDTVPNPKSNYGKAKLQGEELIAPLQDSTFSIAVLRPPMIYGEGCKGNYVRLEKFALKSPIFPNIKNKRSMIEIDKLCEFVKLIIDEESMGLFLPQNEEYVCTSDMVRAIAEKHGKKIYMTTLFNPLLRILKVNTVNKVFGDLVYEKRK